MNSNTAVMAVMTLVLAACASPSVTGPSVANAALGGSQLLQGAQQMNGMAQTAQSIGLTDLLMQRIGVSQAQAQGGAGALFQLAKSQMQANAFSQLSQAVPGMNGLLGAAPALGGLPSMGGSSSGMGMMALASAFQQQGMSPSMIQQFIPVILEYVQGTGGNGVASSLSSVLLGQ